MLISNSKGFTLIELMIVVTILGVLSWFAIPKYQNYSLKATVSTQVNSAIRPLQNAIFEYVAYNGVLPTSFSDLANIGFVDNDGKQYDAASDFANGSVSGIDVDFPSDTTNNITLGVQFACTSIGSGCNKIAPKALQTLTAEVSVILSNNGSVNIRLDPSREANLKFKGFLPSL
ncbi:prepilin-type N-terminal cleavage/methylation domain-containing protein [Psychrosphaera aquimarina]|uniref:Prepilin-type N-terminal cleavage/methylation domain-containing protein n=1 Tax=Psychrosphaera aquimarina TaxID=2044854 RepID=A0ABU3R165_9GAMM|nr:prepilin-type N-terminal cleavage/methylation domain-containing protein [Psychrosphaera aquimarina]MDU0113426.1 prepilin-type N-terminal cleavage/methylation domain-containing protein [Psychrosphaera aquimarina]